MRNRAQGNFLAIRAIGGLHVVTLAWDFVSDVYKDQTDLLGFAIERSEFDAQGKILERYWLRGTKRFKFKDEGLAPGSPVPTSEHPLQTFQWADYTAKPGTAYSYKIVPVYGKPKLLELSLERSAEVSIVTEPEEKKPIAGETVHNVHFNRGVAGSQAYARKFGKQKPDEDDPYSEQMKWLSRGLHEAILQFIAIASGEDAHRYKLRAMLYEFRYPTVARAFAQAAEKGADVDIRYEAQAYEVENEENIRNAGIEELCSPQRSRSGIRHNKFIVLIEDEVPVAILSGSTNISAGGIFGHSNVAHIVWDRTIAGRYMQYWTLLADPDVQAGEIRTFSQKVQPTPASSAVPAGSLLTLFSPRDRVSQGTSPTLKWYAELLRSAKSITCMTFAFNFDPIFEEVVKGETDSINYLVFDKAIGNQREDDVRRSGNTVIAVGSKLSEGDLENFIGEQLTGFNKNRYIHDKFLLIDPLGDNPIVLTGSANFSDPSQEVNDENMLVIAGNTRVADIYFGEFMRIFDHHYVRWSIERAKAKGLPSRPDAGFLFDATEKWLPQHFENEAKKRRRLHFMA